MREGVNHQRPSIPIFAELAVLQNQNFIRALDGREVMGNDQAGSVLQQPVYRAFDELFRRWIKARRGFVEND